MKKWQENKNAKIGIMGGAFNPFHNGHLRHALEVLERMPLDHIEILPSAHHPHKEGLLPFELRIACVESAIKNIPSLSINTMENEISAPSYTEKILKVWRETHPLHKPYFLLGTEDFNVLNTWNNGFEIPKLAHLLIVSRHGGDAEQVCTYAQKYWGEIYISHENLDQESINPASTYTENNDTKNNAAENNETGNDKTGNNAIGNDKADGIFSHNNLVLKDCYEKFSTKSKVSKAEKLHIAIPNKGFCTYLHIPHIDISATQIRRLWAQQKNISGLMPESVQKILEQHENILKKYW